MSLAEDLCCIFRNRRQVNILRVITTKPKVAKLKMLRLQKRYIYDDRIGIPPDIKNTCVLIDRYIATFFKDITYAEIP